MVASAAISETSRPIVPASGAIADSSLRRAIERLTAETGLTFPRSRHARLRRALATATSEAGIASVESFLDELDRRPAFLDRLVSLITIGETYFFRHPDQLDVLSQRILPSLIATKGRDGESSIRAWSAGCSTGEEAYSLAILMDDAVGSLPGWGFRVVGTDIDRDALLRARSGSYGPWSFRTPVDDRSRWFEQDGARLRIRAILVDHVTFAADNLSQKDAGPPRGSGGPLDLIVCRNVAMYLSDGARRRMAARFLRALAPGGWLVVAPVEVSRSIYSSFETVVLDGLTFYRRPLADSSDHPRTEPTRSRTIAPIRLQEPGPVRASRPVASGRLTKVRRLADHGLLREARRESELAVREDPRDGSRYLLLASIADAQDDFAAAAAALRRAVYIDRTDPTAQFRLGLLEWRLGRKRQARARMATAVTLVAERADEETLDPGCDITVGRLRSTVELLADG